MRNRSLTVPRVSSLVLSLAFSLLLPRPMPAQPRAITAEQQTAMLEASRLINTPAEFVLQHRKELVLTDAQVMSIESLSAALRDSATARAARRLRASQKDFAAPALATAMNWNGPIDEKAIRDALRRQSALQADVMIESARDRRAVGALLTSEQRDQLPKLQMAEMSKALRRGTR